ncbi:lysosomal-trafficking regulator-like isoform X5 [Conger conger]|uniref:lysosomal-trafficking regulator-like isoform X5 n=1 Tax=Conger conger TaxID=82655 RepID=UPI002A599C18|nr:lysosomal-trafficking regulator-like isoform X5 [Conger conger]
MSGRINALVRDFLTDVHQMCSAAAEEDQEEGCMLKLSEYLLRGRGFLLLNTMDHVMDQELLGQEELLKLLLSLLPLVWRIPLQNQPEYTLSSLPKVFLWPEGKVFLLRPGKEKAVPEAQEARRSQCQLRTSQRRVLRNIRLSQLSSSDSDTPADKPVSFEGKRHRSCRSTLPVSSQACRTKAPNAPPPDIETMSAPERLDLQQRPDSELLIEPAALSIFNGMEQSPLDLCHVLLSLLEKVCKFDMSLNHNPGLAISVVPTLTQMLVEFGDCCGPGSGGAEDLAQGWTEEPVALVQRMLLRSILHLMSLGVYQGEELPQHLRRNLTGLLQATLKIRSCLERQANPFAPRPKKTLQEVRDDFSFSRTRHQALLMPDLLAGVLQVLLGSLQASAPNPFFFSQAVELLQEFLQHRGLRLLECAVLQLEQPAIRESSVSEEAAIRSREIIAATLNIVTAIKKTKSEQQHQSVCARQHHGRCQYSQFLHHHHDLSGPPASSLTQTAHQNPFQEDMLGEEAPYPERCCCLAAVSQQCLHLLRLLPANSTPSLQMEAGLQAVGICCCMDPSSVVGPLLHLLGLRSPGSPRASVLNLLSHLLLEQLGAGQTTQAANQVACNICTLDSSQLPGLEAALKGGPASPPSPGSQGVLSREGAGGVEDLLCKWEALAAYQDQAFSEDQQLSLLMAAHVRQLVLRGNPVVCWQLYSHIFSPLLQRGVELVHHAQQLGVSTSCAQACSYHSQCLNIEVLQVYIRTLPALLQSSRMTWNLFLSCNGLNQVTELVYLDATRPWALKVFEMFILSESEEQSDTMPQDPVPTETGATEGVGGSPSTLCEGLRDRQSHQSREVVGMGLGHSGDDTHLSTIHLFLRMAFLCVSRDSDSDRDSANDSEDTSGYDSTASEPRAACLPRLSPDRLALPSGDQVRRAADVWTVCRAVYLSSSTFQRQFYRLGGLEVCPHLITLVIQTLASKTWDSRARRREPRGKAVPAHPDTAQGSADPPGPERGEAPARDGLRGPEEEWALDSLRLLEVLISICLHSCSMAQHKNEPHLPPQLQSVEKVLAGVRDQLCGLGVVDTDLAIPLFDSLLRVALCSSSRCEATEEKNALSLWEEEFVPPTGDLSEETEGPQGGEFRTLGGEEGYEADSESDPEYNIHPAGEEKRLAQVWRSVFGMNSEGRGREELLFPEICTMELQLLSASSPNLEVLLHVLHSLLGVVRKNPHNATLLYQQGAVETILGGFQNILNESDSSFQACQVVLVELLVAMVRDHITAEEVALLIRLFLEKETPTDVVLKGILHIVQANMDMESLHFLSFPLLPNTSCPGPRHSRGGRAWKGKPSLGGREGSGETRPAHQLTSPWYVAPIHLPLVGQNCWPHIADGFSLSLWMRVPFTAQEISAHLDRKSMRSTKFRDSKEDSTEQEKCPSVGRRGTLPGDSLVEEGFLHIASLGSKALMLQLWAHLSTGTFLFRISVDPNDEMKAGLLAQAESGEGLLVPGQWQHVALTYTQQPEGKKNVSSTLVLWVCGVRKCELSLDYTLPRKSSLSTDTKTFCLLGHYLPCADELDRQKACWDMGCVMLFNGSRVSLEEAFYLYACGPDCTSVIPCKYGTPSPKVSRYMTQEGLQDWDMVSRSRAGGPDTASLIEGLAVVYIPSCPSQYSIYEPLAGLKGQPKMAVTQRTLSTKMAQSNVLEPQALRTLRPSESQGLQSVLHTIGGAGTFIFLFARVVELSDSEQTQALVLQILLSLVKQNQHRVQEMDSCHGYSMIHQVLINTKCIVGYHILKAVLDGCCSQEILTVSEDGHFCLNTESTAVVQDLRLLSVVLLDWKIWSRAKDGVWETLLAALEILIRVHHPQQSFNIQQLLKAQVVHCFLLTCQVLQEQLTPISQEVCLSFTKIIQEVLGSPPDLDLLRLIYNFLLAVHPPTKTHVCHTPTSFYFYLHIDGNLHKEKVQSIVSLRQLSRGEQSSSSSVLSSSPISFTAAQPQDPVPPPSPEQDGEDQPLPPSSDAPSPPSSPSLSHGEGDGGPSGSHQSSTETVRREGGEALLSSSDSGSTVCDLRRAGGVRDASPVSVEEEPEEGDVAERFDSASVEVPCRPDSLQRLHSPQRRNSAFTSLGLAFPTHNGTLPITRRSSLVFPAHNSAPPITRRCSLAFPAHNGAQPITRRDSLAFPTHNCSMADSGMLPMTWESYAYRPGYQAYSRAGSTDRSAVEDCLVLMCCGLYELLKGTLLLLPDRMLDQVMDKLIQPQALMVLINHSSPLIQLSVMKLLDAYFIRATKEQKEKFVKGQGFSLLANQLYQQQGSQELLEFCLEMLFGRPVGLEDELDLEDTDSTDPFRKRCIIPLLGLIENSLYESTLLHSALSVLRQLLNACPKLGDILLDHGLLYVLLNTLATLNGLEDGMALNEYRLLLCDIQQLLVAVTVHSCSSSGSQYFRIMEDLITLLGHLHSSSVQRTREMAVVLQFKVLQSAIEFIRTTANKDAPNESSSEDPPPSPRRSLQQKRRSIAGSMATKDSLFPRIPRQHYCSYGQIPLPSPFSFLSQDCPLPSPTGTTSFLLPADAGRRRLSMVQSDSLLTRVRSMAGDDLTQMMQLRMSEENRARASESELIQRLQRLVVLAVNRLIYHDIGQDCFDLLNIPESPERQPSPGEPTPGQNGLAPPLTGMRSFQKAILKLMVEGMKISLAVSGRSGAPRQQWRRMLWSCRDTFRVQIGRLLVHALSPARPLQSRKEALELVYEPCHPGILQESLSPGLEHGPKLALYLYELLRDHKDKLSKEEQTAGGVFLTSLKLCGHRCVPPNAPPKPDLIKAIKEEQQKYLSDENMSKAAWEKKMGITQKSLMQRLDSKSKDISRMAADITQNVSLRQGLERKKVIQHIRRLYRGELSASRFWKEQVQQLTHDRAVWYDQASYPTSWQLDPTEGPNRERRRLQRCHLTVPKKHLLQDRRKPEDQVKPPLSYLFEDKSHLYSSTVKDKATSEPIRFTRRCINVAPSRETAGELLLGKSGMYFVEDSSAEAHDTQDAQEEMEPASFSWTYEEIKEVHKRWWQLKDSGVEIFLTNGRTFLLAFDNTKFRDVVYQNILSSNLPNLLEYGNIMALTHLWSTGQISTFEYLTHLNKHAGRSFNDLMQYPVFPFILRDYTSDTLDLNDAAIYRNLSKPIAVQSKEKEDRYVSNYKYLEEEFRRGTADGCSMPPVQPYHYGCHYSNSGTVLHFLLRVPPFTDMFLVFQDHNFDIPDRTFHCMETTWRLSSYESMTDVKELIPEFFYLPEFLVNREGFDFGVRQNGERVDHVSLPPWARNDPRLFVLIHRQALESDQVSQTLCHWIDLVFGVKQKGKAAIQAVNVFHPATYFGMDVSAVEDPVQRRALETMIKTYGQMPRQLFSSAHTGRTAPHLLTESELPAAVGLFVQRAFRDSKEPLREVVCQSPLPWITGLKWGEYVGSPSAPEPVVCFSQPHGEHFGTLLALPTRAVCGLSRNFCLMMIYSKEQGVRSMHSTDIQWSAILSWGYADNILRLKSKQSEPPVNFIQSSHLYQVSSCAWVPDSCQLFTGIKCGVILAYHCGFTNTVPSELEVDSQVHLYGHTAEVTHLFVCKPYSVLISGSQDGTCILWDLNRLCYIQSLGHKNPVTAVSASETTGDIATVCDSAGGGSDLRLWTVNGALIELAQSRETIHSLAFSNQPEGMSVNVIAGGLENGVVRLWSTWDLKPVREITFPKSNKPIISLAFSCEGHHLYTANSDGTVLVWCRRDQQRMKLPMFYSFLSSYAAG